MTGLNDVVKFPLTYLGANKVLKRGPSNTMSTRKAGEITEGILRSILSCQMTHQMG